MTRYAVIRAPMNGITREGIRLLRGSNSNYFVN